MPKEIWEEWFKREQEKLKDTESRKGKRGYLHFDNRFNDLDEARTRALLLPDNVATRPFYPFIRIDAREERYRRIKSHQPGDRHREHTVKKRPIDYAAHKDALVFSWYAFLVSIAYEKELARRGIGPHVIAYRALKKPDGTGKTNVDFSKEAFDFIEANEPCHVLAIDVTKFYEEIDHEILKRQWALLLGHSTLPADHHQVFKALTDYRFVRKARILRYIERASRQQLKRICTPEEFKKWIIDKHLQEKGSVREKVIGIPQGAPISCVLANTYMLEFDSAVASFIKSIPKGLYQRYSDDILIVCAPEDAKRVEEFVIEEIKKLKLRIKPEKTEHRLFVTNDGVTHYLEPKTGRKMQLQYLGIATDGVSRFLRHGSIARSQRRMNRGVKRAIHFAKIKEKGLPKRFLHKKYAVPHNNFLAYAKRAENVLNTGAITKQISPLKAGRRVKKILNKKEKAAH